VGFYRCHLEELCDSVEDRGASLEEARANLFVLQQERRLIADLDALVFDLIILVLDFIYWWFGVFKIGLGFGI
jgi:hypothetical protein